MRKSKQTIKRFLDELAQVPNVSLACKKTGISRQTLYRWKRDDAEFAQQLNQYYDVGIDSISDLAESKLVEKIQTGDFRAMKFWLENNNKRYIRPRQSITHGLLDLQDTMKGGEVIIKVISNSDAPAPTTIRYPDSA
jgi:hypothetical protein